MDLPLLHQVVSELHSALVGGRINRVFQDARGNILLSLSRTKNSHTLFLSADAAFPSLYLVSRKHGARNVPDGFTLFLRANLLRATLVDAGLLNDDRIVEFGFLKGKERYRLVVELFGPRPNIVLIDDERRVLACLHPGTPGEQGDRVLPGVFYAPPPMQGRKKRAPGAVYAIPGNPEASANLFAEQWHERMLAEQEEAHIRQDLARSLNKALTRAKRKEAAIKGDLAASERSDEYRSAGELILKNLSSIKRGDTMVPLSGYDGRRITVHLAPRLSPTENAERYFKKYKKAKAGRSISAERLAWVRSEIARLSALVDTIRTSADQGAIRSLHAEVREAGLVRGVRNRAQAAVRSAQPSGHRSFRLGGWDILVGKNARGNDALLRNSARPDDLWLHAEGMAGSHVVIRNPRRIEVPPDVLDAAASLAAYYSAGKDAEKVPVVYTEAKYVRRPKGAAPGLVTLVRKRSLMARPRRTTGHSGMP